VLRGIIDDDNLILRLLRDSLEEEYEVVTTNSGQEGIELALEGQFPIIFLDYRFPKITGLDILKKLRAHNIVSQVILATGYPTYELAIEFSRLNVFDFFPKPFKLDKLNHVVDLAWDKHCTIELNKRLQEDLLIKNQQLEKVNSDLVISAEDLDQTKVDYQANLAYSERLLSLIAIFQEIGKFHELDSLQAFIINSVTNILGADRSSLFIVDRSSNELYSKIAQGVGSVEIRFPIGVGIAGTVAANKDTILIPDAYQDDRFNPSFDKKTGYVTRNILCMPMLNIKAEVIGVIQVLNKLEGDFTEIDLNLLTAFNALAGMSLESVLASAEVSLLNSNLKLALRESQLVLDHIHEGFCIIDIHGKVRSGYSSICKSFFGVDSFEDFSIFDHPFKGFTKESRSFIKTIHEWIELGFENPSLDFWEEMSCDIKLQSMDYVINLTLKRIGNKSKVEGVMLNIQDVTEAHNLAIQSEKDKKKSNLVLELSNSILTHGQVQFYSYISSQREYLDEIETMYQQSLVDLQDVHKVFRAFHSFKSLVMTFAMNTLAEKVHDQEDLWMDIRDSYIDPLSVPLSLAATFVELKEIVIEVEGIFEKLYPKHLIEHFSDKSSNGIYQYSYRKSDLSYQAVSQLLKSEALLHAESLNKEIKWITHKRDLIIPQDVWDSLRIVFSHLIKNSIDHGLESNDHREQLGKDKVGYLFFDCFTSYDEQDSFITFIFKDDGQGIDPYQIRNKAFKKGLISPENSISIEDAHNLIFLPGLSTREEVSLMSGRGVGMDIVKETVEDLCGDIVLTNNPGHGLEVNIKIKVA
ncbi:response regulator, partial [bacterium]|nr:response regulator [bacterium]